MKRSSGYRLSAWRRVFYLLLASGIVLAVVRFTQGLAAVTNLSDTFPWGLWVGFDILCGIGLAAGAFTITAIVYIFNAERFEPIVPPSVLTAFLGYLLVATALLFDLGRPWNLWHVLIMWNPRSILFEVAWCAILYSAVLALELSGLVFEKLGWKRAIKIQRVFSVPLVVVGVLLSTLHQSSLGALYLIAPGKLHPLWYTPNLPHLFIASAISVGLAMIVVESRLSARAFGRQLEMPLLTEVGRYLMTVLGIYGVMRLCDLRYHGGLGYIFNDSYESWMFQLEYVVGVVLPVAILAMPKMRESGRGLYAASLLTVLGFIANRLNVSITGLEGAQGHYIPALSEVVITLALIAVGFGAFSLAVRYLNIYPSETGQERNRDSSPPWTVQETVSKTGMS